MARKTWPIVVGGLVAAGAAALISIVLLDLRDEARKDRARARAAELERDAAQARAVAQAEADIRAAQEAAIAAAEQVQAAAEEERKRRAARAEAIEQARNAGLLDDAALTQGGRFGSITGTGDISGGFGLGRHAIEPDVDDTVGMGTLRMGGAGGGVGYGPGVLAGKAPSVSVTVTEQDGGLDPDLVQRIVRSRSVNLRICYTQQLLVAPALSGTVTARFAIDENGAVTDATASGVDDEVARCMASVFHGTSFPRPQSRRVSVTARIELRPASKP